MHARNKRWLAKCWKFDCLIFKIWKGDDGVVIRCPPRLEFWEKLKRLVLELESNFESQLKKVHNNIQLYEEFHTIFAFQHAQPLLSHNCIFSAYSLKETGWECRQHCVFFPFSLYFLRKKYCKKIIKIDQVIPTAKVWKFK